MEYPKKLMKASELEVLLGLPRRKLADLYHLPGQHFAFKFNPTKLNSSIYIDTEEFEKWRIRQQKMAGRRVVV